MRAKKEKILPEEAYLQIITLHSIISILDNVLVPSKRKQVLVRMFQNHRSEAMISSQDRQQLRSKVKLVRKNSKLLINIQIIKILILSKTQQMSIIRNYSTYMKVNNLFTRRHRVRYSLFLRS